MVQNVLSIARKLCERVHRSPRAREKLAELQKDYELPQYQLIQDVPSKWSMSFHMLERLIKQKRAVNEVSIECNFRELISCDHWELMQSVCHVLRPFDAASREMSAHMSTLSHVIPMIHILSRRVEILFGETMGIDTMLKSLKEAWRAAYLPPSTTPEKVPWDAEKKQKYGPCFRTHSVNLCLFIVGKIFFNDFVEYVFCAFELVFFSFFYSSYSKGDCLLLSLKK
ncbi:hypothetical protein STEG23_016751 [Scotinomys teguina]